MKKWPGFMTRDISIHGVRYRVFAFVESIDDGQVIAYHAVLNVRGGNGRMVDSVRVPKDEIQGAPMAALERTLRTRLDERHAGLQACGVISLHHRAHRSAPMMNAITR